MRAQPVPACAGNASWHLFRSALRGHIRPRVVRAVHLLIHMRLSTSEAIAKAECAANRSAACYILSPTGNDQTPHAKLHHRTKGQGVSSGPTTESRGHLRRYHLTIFAGEHDCISFVMADFQRFQRSPLLLGFVGSNLGMEQSILRTRALPCSIFTPVYGTINQPAGQLHDTGHQGSLPAGLHLDLTLSTNAPTRWCTAYHRVLHNRMAGCGVRIFGFNSRSVDRDKQTPTAPTFAWRFIGCLG